MPFVQTTLRRGMSQQYLSSVVESIHRGLVEEFKRPELDKFQSIRQVDAGEFIFPPSYLGIPHTEDLIYIHITCKGGRTTQMKKNLYARIAQLIAESTDLSINDVFIVLAENHGDDWSFGGGKAQLASEA
jgi:phenylpyruvate tautomerase PptA (4-oxalocrotonate tautomerase family)